ncbi:MAG: alpha-ketoglutarate-dependent dioxygenase AlkB, partial [Methyloligellaceae bacterium]
MTSGKIVEAPRRIGLEAIPGCRYFPAYLDAAAQALILEDVRSLIQSAPLYRPHMPRSGRPFSVRMTNCGTLGWVSDKDGGYRYQAHHPETGASWPPIPEAICKIWTDLADYSGSPEACLINFYDPLAKMGLHCDEDEQDMS